jgi:hypothetical protein
VMKSNIKERTEYDAAIVCDQTNLSPTGEPRTLPSGCRLYMMIYGDGSTGQRVNCINMSGRGHLNLFLDKYHEGSTVSDEIRDPDPRESGIAGP